MKILLLGKNGQVGWELQRALAPLGELIALDREGTSNLCGDLSNLEGLQDTLYKIKPDAVINAAAYTAVDNAESNTDLAFVINEEAPKILAKTMANLGGWLIHYSTDYVFDGNGNTPWKEEDKTGPLSVYGASKLAGEKAIQQSGCKHLIFRTSWVYAARGMNFAKTMIKLASERETLRVISDQIGAPTGAELIADISAHTLQAVIKQPSLAGLYHLAAGGEVSWHEYACYVIELAKIMDWSLKVQDINEIPTSAYPTPATRPLNSRLNCNKLKENFCLYLPDWKLGVKRMIIEAQG